MTRVLHGGSGTMVTQIITDGMRWSIVDRGFGRLSFCGT